MGSGGKTVSTSLNESEPIAGRRKRPLSAFSGWKWIGRCWLTTQFGRRRSIRSHARLASDREISTIVHDRKLHCVRRHDERFRTLCLIKLSIHRHEESCGDGRRRSFCLDINCVDVRISVSQSMKKC